MTGKKTSSAAVETESPISSPRTLESMIEDYYEEARELKKEREQAARSTKIEGASAVPRLEPDDAMRKLGEAIREAVISIEEHKTGQFNIQARTVTLARPPLPALNVLRKAHHRAVDLFYSTYALDRKGAGRPRLPEKDCWLLLRMSNDKKSYLQMAKEMGLPTRIPEERTAAKEKIRQRLRIAIKRLI